MKMDNICKIIVTIEHIQIFIQYIFITFVALDM